VRRRVRAVLLEKGLSWTSRVLDLMRMEQKRPEYLALNPNGVVPTLVHGERVLYEMYPMVQLDLEPARLPRLCDWLARVSARSSFARSEAVRPD